MVPYLNPNKEGFGLERLDQPNLPKLELEALVAQDQDNLDNSSILFKEPKSYKEAISSKYKGKWLKSMKIEYNSVKNT